MRLGPGAETLITGNVYIGDSGASRQLALNQGSASGNRLVFFGGVAPVAGAVSIIQVVSGTTGQATTFQSGLDVSSMTWTANAATTIAIAADLALRGGGTKSGTGTITTAARLYVADAPTVGSTNYAVWVDAGDSRFDGIVNSAMGTGTGLQRLGGVADINTTAVGNVGAGEDDLITYSLPADALSGNGKGIRIRAWGTGANNANIKTLKLYFGTQIIQTTSLTVSQVDTWYVEATVWRTGVDTQDWQSILIEGGTATLTEVENGTAIQDDGVAIVIKTTGEATATNDIVCEGQFVEFIN